MSMVQYLEAGKWLNRNRAIVVKREAERVNVFISVLSPVLVISGMECDSTARLR